ncbi:hypothetical protein GCM10027284_32260 [Cyclobacterium sediminis]
MFFWDKSPSLEIQVFNVALVILIGFALFLAIINLWLQNYSLVKLCLIVVVSLSVFIYLLRVKHAFKTAFYLASFSTYPILLFNFFHNDGIIGPTFYILSLIHLLILTIVNTKHYTFWSTLNVLFYFLLYCFGLYYGELIPENYNSRFEILTDHLLTYSASILGVTMIMFALKRFILNQKRKVKEKTVALLKINKDLKQTNNQKDRIIAIISHDLKNPLQSIIQTLELINSGDLTEEEIKFLRKELLKSTKNTYKMMEDILEWSSFEIKNASRKEKKIKIKDLIEDTVEILRVIAKQKSIELEVNYHENPLLNLETDRLLLIVRNLVQNAIKFTPSGGHVIVDIYSQEEQLTLQITDNGVGISPKRLKNIFEQDIKSTYGTEQEKGTGMGLHMCFQSAHKLSGKLEVQSTEGVGSTFKLVIPTGIN